MTEVTYVTDEMIAEIRRKSLQADEARRQFILEGESFEGYHTMTQDNPGPGELGNYNYYHNNEDPKKEFRISSGREFITAADPTKVMSMNEYLDSQILKGKGEQIAFAVYSKPRKIISPLA